MSNTPRVNRSALERAKKEIKEDGRWDDPEYVLAHYKTQKCPFISPMGKDKTYCELKWDCPWYHSDLDRRRENSSSSTKDGLIACHHVYDGQTKNWLEPGKCPLVDRCPNAHSRNESQYHPLRYKQKRCRDWDATQSCPRGRFCAYTHTPPGESSSTRTQANPAPGTSSSQRKPNSAQGTSSFTRGQANPAPRTSSSQRKPNAPAPRTSSSQRKPNSAQRTSSFTRGQANPAPGTSSSRQRKTNRVPGTSSTRRANPTPAASSFARGETNPGPKTSSTLRETNASPASGTSSSFKGRQSNAPQQAGSGIPQVPLVHSDSNSAGSISGKSRPRRWELQPNAPMDNSASSQRNQVENESLSSLSYKTPTPLMFPSKSVVNRLIESVSGKREPFLASKLSDATDICDMATVDKSSQYSSSKTVEPVHSEIPNSLVVSNTANQLQVTTIKSSFISKTSASIEGEQGLKTTTGREIVNPPTLLRNPDQASFSHPQQRGTYQNFYQTEHGNGQLPETSAHVPVNADPSRIRERIRNGNFYYTQQELDHDYEIPDLDLVMLLDMLQHFH